MKSKKIVFTGGGSTGHVTVNLALIPYYQEQGYSVHYIGSRQGIEAELIGRMEGVKYKGIATGKLRRYFSVENAKDSLRVLKGVREAYQYLKKIKPGVVFSKGGFVSVPVVLAARILRIPIVIHESDLTPGLANRIALPWADYVCTTFQEAATQLRKSNVVHVGAMIRQELREGNRQRGRSRLGFSDDKPVLLFMGGSLGAKNLNEALYHIIPDLISDYQIIHICGKGQQMGAPVTDGYHVFEYVQEELPDLMAAADLVISRAGSNSIFEFLALHKPMLLIPLSDKVSRGDQIINARSFEASGYARVLLAEDLTASSLLNAIHDLDRNQEKYIQNMRAYRTSDAMTNIIKVIQQAEVK
ncbi:undecaprenyldiphospho-muramoylpentapeptide beta-N-acetylglucosaminyltransferase [Paenibacillus urinalis]|uniref:UDP-N-acetylglucosamine--N-acetylmuramyl-(pentapeptide) pyrophosphoryl-undecaprenol N-acetylglucosamine transferase n=1 Tax=Paenibacillus urinalis TaxID=521520 RepID=A0AAX3N611_9BACL|nr:undecaprenyldiphospho-muramoylpentapeptide beta-N-acetylglucosaminyltransferase [Paenibacillus urinalis]WDH84119.1 undecaprenyldiphospho-muramoylpentapeptide beta-N-acetylglucosaminyltransferase [Paenibacillus urinalis]WDH95562.1 undecaprenyldiphospho-muramoylpentapeptide beta-N-acetylglucosaminyltransferase [Paenibacillus urinalis]WDI03759.1 undecaprenyldiphospho-muramoylpentapeptide beta-N-acetylglucosaminyltransferase [Paenibacillus urinalis]